MTLPGVCVSSVTLFHLSENTGDPHPAHGHLAWRCLPVAVPGCCQSYSCAAAQDCCCQTVASPGCYQSSLFADAQGCCPHLVAGPNCCQSYSCDVFQDCWHVASPHGCQPFDHVVSLDCCGCCRQTGQCQWLMMYKIIHNIIIHNIIYGRVWYPAIWYFMLQLPKLSLQCIQPCRTITMILCDYPEALIINAMEWHCH